MDHEQLDEGKVSLKSVKHPEHTDNMSDETALKIFNHYDKQAAVLSGKPGMGMYSKNPRAFTAEDGQKRDHLFTLRQRILKTHPNVGRMLHDKMQAEEVESLDENLQNLKKQYIKHHINTIEDPYNEEKHEKRRDAIGEKIKAKYGQKAVDDIHAKAHAELFGEEVESLDEVGDTKRGQKRLAKVGKRATDRLIKATDPMWKSGMSDYLKMIKKQHQIMADDRMKEDVESLDEFNADGENSSVADSTGASAKKRKADKTDAGEPMQKVSPLRSDEVGGNLLSVSTTKMPARKADKSMKEEVLELFDGELSEEFLDKASTMFEAAVIERVNLEVEALEEEYNEVLNEAVNEVRAELSAKMDDYLDYVVEQWMKDNEVAIESGIKTEITESFFAGLKTLFAEHYVDVPEDKVDLAESLAFKIAELEGELNSAITRNIELSNILESNELEAAFDEVTDGLAVSQKERLASLAESLVFSSVDEYQSKLEVIKETFLAGSKKLSMASTEKALNEEFDGENTSNEVSNDPQMETYLNAVKKTIKR